MFCTNHNTPTLKLDTIQKTQSMSDTKAATREDTLSHRDTHYSRDTSGKQQKINVTPLVSLQNKHISMESILSEVSNALAECKKYQKKCFNPGSIRSIESDCSNDTEDLSVSSEHASIADDPFYSPVTTFRRTFSLFSQPVQEEVEPLVIVKSVSKPVGPKDPV